MEPFIQPTEVASAAQGKNSRGPTSGESPQVLLLRSLRIRMIVPLASTALMVSLGIAAFSYHYGTRQADAELETRFQLIKSRLFNTTYPLSATVLDSLAEWTETDLASFDSTGRLQHQTRAGIQSALAGPQSSQSQYVVREFSRAVTPTRIDDVTRVAVAFDRQQLIQRSRQAALLPLMTGGLTVILFCGVCYGLMSRLVRRIERLQLRVQTISEGDFTVPAAEPVDDELGRLGRSVDVMATELQGLWKQLQQQQSEKLMHQIAGGLAHQLRNSLTGGRMAVELHAKECPLQDDESLKVAVQQFEDAEDYIQRLLLAATGRTVQPSEMTLKDCFDHLQSTLQPITRHLRKHLEFGPSESFEHRKVPDGRAFISAVSNLVHNGLQAGNHVTVDARLTGDRITVLVVDDGPGIAPGVRDGLFDPFITTKPEGLGLGLPVVRQAAATLHGSVDYRRTASRTEFRFECSTLS
ncbi:MAG: HAMP domain-containing sensor histidine kinase [Planctomycetota bacterium]